MGNVSTLGLQQPLPEEYLEAAEAELDERIARARRALGSDLVILGHHYQRDDVIKFADHTGDSFKLAAWAAKQEQARYIVFCGVHFMAETADILSRPEQTVILPDLSAGCSMADMASLEQVEEAWESLTGRLGPSLIPITYMNSTAEIKAFVGRHGGLVCTSSNAAAAVRWALERGERALFLPDQHLGRNTGVAMGIPLEQMPVWDPGEGLGQGVLRSVVLGREGRLEWGGQSWEEARQARLILWRGHCSVHQQFTPEQVDYLRRQQPGIRIIAHPECSYEVVQKADDAGSTEHIIKQVAASPPGSIWGVGTEIHLVSRLAREHPDKTVLSLTPFACACSSMYRIDQAHLCWSLESLDRGQVVNPITVPEQAAADARLALDRMLTLK